MAFEEDLHQSQHNSLDFTHDNTHDHHQQEMAQVQPSKRDADSLLASEDGAAGKTAEPNPKRPKTTGNSLDMLAGLKMNEDGRVAPYEAFKVEGRPHLAIYHPSFALAEKLITKICKGFLGTVQEVKESGYTNDEIDLICKKKLNDYINVKERYPSIKPVACLGPAGVGKSSDMNCLLNQPGAAHESDSAHRGTNLVHEFSAAYLHQTALYQVAAPYLRETQVEKLVDRYCENIFDFLNQVEEHDEDELSEAQKKYDTAIEFFRILLCDQPEFASAEDAEDFFDSHRIHTEKQAAKDLKNWIEAFKKSKKLIDGYEYHNAESVKELSEIFKKVSRVPKAGSQPHPWPIISKVQIHQDNDLLNAGVILGDTPGVCDSNQSVVDTTLKYVKKAGTVLVFEDFKRIAESESLESNLRDCIRLGKANSTHLIVTMIDGQRIKPEDREELSEADRKKLDDAEGFVSSLKAEEKLMKQRKGVALQEANFEQLRSLEDDLEHMPAKIAIAETKVSQAAVEIRTREVANELRGKLRKLDKSRNGPDLPVHFISNTQYQAHLYGYDAKKPPILDVEGTGIPSVRRMLYEIPARGKSTTLARVCRTILPSIFGSITGVLTKSSLERKQDVEKVIVNNLGAYNVLIDDLMADIKDKFETHITAVIDHNRYLWESKGERMAVGWGEYKSMTLLAFCRRAGRWRLKRGKEKEPVSWNENIINIMAEKLADGFNALDEDILSIEKHLAFDIDELFKGLETKLDECPDFQGITGTKSFYQIIQLTRDSVLNDMKRVFNNLHTRVSGLRHACLFDEGSYVQQGMQGTYEQCQLISNPEHKQVNPATGKRKYQKKSTIHPRRVELLRQKLRGAEEPSIFAEVGIAAKSAFEETVTEWNKNQCTPKLADAYNYIMKDFDTRFAVCEEVQIEEDEEAIARLKDAADEALKMVEGPLLGHLEACEAYEKNGGL